MRRWAMRAFRFLPGWGRRLLVHVGAPSFSVGAVAVLKRSDGRMLFVDQRHTGGWALPGGLLRHGEAAADAVVREVAEEVGVPLDPASLPVPLAAVDPHARRVDLVYVLPADDAADPRTGDEAEVRRVAWFALDELPALTEPTWQILDAVRLR